MKIRLVNTLTREIRYQIPNRQPLNILSANSRKLTFEVIKDLAFETEAALGELSMERVRGNIAYLSSEGSAIGITTTRPLLGIVTNTKPLKIAGFSYRNCSYINIYDIFGGLPLLKSPYRSNLLILPEEQKDDVKKVHKDRSDYGSNFGQVEKDKDNYFFHQFWRDSGPSLFGSLEYRFQKKGKTKGFMLFPVWKDIPMEELKGEIKWGKLNLIGLVNCPFTRRSNHSFYGILAS